MKERRQYIRKEIALEVVVILPDGTELVTHTGNTSIGGALILGDKTTLPEIGTEIGITVRNPIAGKQAPVYQAKVIQKMDEGIGIQLLIPNTLPTT